MTTPTTGAAELPEALKHAEGLESFAGQLPAYGFNPQPLKDAATHLRRQHALLNEQQRTIEALNACINGEGSTTTENLRLVDRLHADNEALRAQPAGAQVPEAVLQAIRAAGMHLIRGMNDVYSLIPAMNATAQPAGAATPAAQEPFAYAVYFPDHPCEELVHDLDELLDDLTNREHVITNLYTQPAVTAGEVDALDAARWRAWANAMVEACNHSGSEEPPFLEALGNAIGDAEPPITLDQLNAWTDAALAAQREVKP